MSADISFRAAITEDVATLVAMLADDPLGAQRENIASPLPPCYRAAFAAIDADPNNELMVMTLAGEIVGVLQLTFIPSLTRQGGWRAQIEGVRIANRHRGKSYGRKMFERAIQRAQERGCHLVQLTSDLSRPDALRFYENLGFTASHAGMKLHLKPVAK